MEADSVVCSRAIPKFKAKLVRLVKSHKKVVLAIGDGANDVNMLTVSEIGNHRKLMWVLVCMVRKECKLSKPLIMPSPTLNFCGN